MAAPEAVPASARKEFESLSERARRLDLSRDQDRYQLGEIYNRIADGGLIAKSGATGTVDDFFGELEGAIPELTVATAQLCARVAKAYMLEDAVKHGVFRLDRLMRIWARAHPDEPWPDPNTAMVEVAGGAKPFPDCANDELDATLAQLGEDVQSGGGLDRRERHWLELALGIVAVIVAGSVLLFWETAQTHLVEKRLTLFNLRPAHLGAAGLVFAAVDLRMVFRREERFTWARRGVRTCNVALVVANAVLVALLLLAR